MSEYKNGKDGRPILRLPGTEFHADDAGNVLVTEIARTQGLRFQRVDLPDIIKFLQDQVERKPTPPKKE